VRALAGFSGDPAGLVTACRRLVQRQPAMAPVWWAAARLLVTPDPHFAEAAKAESALLEDRTASAVAHQLDVLVPDGGTALVVGPPWYSGDALVGRGDIVVLAADTPAGYGLARALQAADVDAVSVPDAGVGTAAAHADVVIIDATAVAFEGVIAASGARAAAAVAHAAGRTVLVAAGAGTVLPGPLWGALRAALEGAGDAWDAEFEFVPLDLVDTIAGPSGALEPARAVGRWDCPVAPELLRPLT